MVSQVSLIAASCVGRGAQKRNGAESESQVSYLLAKGGGWMDSRNSRQRRAWIRLRSLFCKAELSSSMEQFQEGPSFDGRKTQCAQYPFYSL